MHCLILILPCQSHRTNLKVCFLYYISFTLFCKLLFFGLSLEQNNTWLLKVQQPCIIKVKIYSSFIFAKQSLQNTGLSSLGLKGTLASAPQEAQVAANISF